MLDAYRPALREASTIVGVQEELIQKPTLAGRQSAIVSVSVTASAVWGTATTLKRRSRQDAHRATRLIRRTRRGGSIPPCSRPLLIHIQERESSTNEDRPAAEAEQRQAEAGVARVNAISTSNMSRNARRPAVVIKIARVPEMRTTHPRSKAVRHKQAPTIPAM